jgi:hypothetical protein
LYAPPRSSRRRQMPRKKNKEPKRKEEPKRKVLVCTVV